MLELLLGQEVSIERYFLRMRSLTSYTGDVAISTAAFILVSSNLQTLLTLTDLSRKVFSRVKFNFVSAAQRSSRPAQVLTDRSDYPALGNHL